MKVTDLGKVIAPNADHEIIGIRPGEKLHEQMISEEDALSTYEYDDYYKILPCINGWCDDPNRIKDGKLVESGFTYNSGTNSHWMTSAELREWLKNNKSKLGSI